VDDEVQLPEPAAELLAVAARTVPGWLRRITLDAAVRGGADVVGDGLDAMADRVARRTLGELEALLRLDVDDQDVNPLTVLRGAIAEPTEFLRARGVTPARLDPFVVERFPDDVYGLGPATWSDVDPSLHEPGLMWGAWKAMTVLRRRRDEGRR
jgi:hypothetical protein